MYRERLGRVAEEPTDLLGERLLGLGEVEVHRMRAPG
jgi:hypothetical protein